MDEKLKKILDWQASSGLDLNAFYSIRVGIHDIVLQGHYNCDNVAMLIQAGCKLEEITEKGYVEFLPPSESGITSIIFT